MTRDVRTPDQPAMGILPPFRGGRNTRDSQMKTDIQHKFDSVFEEWRKCPALPYYLAFVFVSRLEPIPEVRAWVVASVVRDTDVEYDEDGMASVTSCATIVGPAAPFPSEEAALRFATDLNRAVDSCQERDGDNWFGVRGLFLVVADDEGRPAVTHLQRPKVWKP